MIYYLPERIYALFKENKNYSTLAKKIEDKKAKIDSIEEYMKESSREYETILKNYTPIYNFFVKKLKNKPVLLSEFKICNSDYTKQQMIDMYNHPDETIDIENKFYLLSNIVNKAYEGTTTHDDYVEEYAKYMRIYKDLYESLSEEEKKSLSKYIHLKYIYCKIWDICENCNTTEEKWYEKLFLYCTTIYEKQLDYTNNSDITVNYFIESVCTGINLIQYNTHSDALKLIILFRNFIESKEFQYKECSFGYLKLMDMEFLYYLMSGDITSLYNQAMIIYRYISNAFGDIHNMFRGLAYYDKTNLNMWCSLVRLYIKMKDKVILFHRIPLENISEENKKFILSDKLCSLAVDTPNKFSEENFKDSVDLFIDNANGLFDRVNRIIGE